MAQASCGQEPGCVHCVASLERVAVQGPCAVCGRRLMEVFALPAAPALLGAGPPLAEPGSPP